MAGLCGRWPLTIIGGGEELFCLRGSAVAEVCMGTGRRPADQRKEKALCKVMGNQAGGCDGPRQSKTAVQSWAKLKLVAERHKEMTRRFSNKE